MYRYMMKELIVIMLALVTVSGATFAMVAMLS